MQVKQIPLKDILLVENTRGESMEVGGLMKSIKESGLFQPVCVGKNFTGKGNQPYVLAAGNRRLAACKKLGMKDIPAVVNPSVKSMKDLMIINLSENIQKEVVSAYEQGRFIYKLVNEEDMSLNECSAKLGAPVTLIRQLLSSYEQTPKKFIKDVVHTGDTTKSKKGQIPVSAAIKINALRKQKLVTSTQAEALYKKVKSNEYSKSDLDEVSRKIRDGATYGKVVAATKKLTTQTVRFQVVASERDKLCKKYKCGWRELAEKIMFGEVKERLTRPRVQ